MNCVNLYVTTSQIVLNSVPNNPNTWQDLYRLVPYLRNSLCCVVCGNLLLEPLTPSVGKCQHHLCKKCRGGRKKIKPACTWCKDCKDYNENKQLRILLQCYKKMCITLINSGIYRGLIEQASKDPPAVGVERGAGNLIMLIKEGAAFQDEYQSSAGLSKSVYSILPCVYTNSSTQTLHMQENTKGVLNCSSQNVTNRSALYSVMYAGTGNKITIKRKPKDLSENRAQRNHIQTRKDCSDKVTTDSNPEHWLYLILMVFQGLFKKPPAKCIVKQQKKGCRCGNATATPGKLTCCGQRCPCYVDGKACIECKCRGCRNPHTPDGTKVSTTRWKVHKFKWSDSTFSRKSYKKKFYPDFLFY